MPVELYDAAKTFFNPVKLVIGVVIVALTYIVLHLIFVRKKNPVRQKEVIAIRYLNLRDPHFRNQKYGLFRFITAQMSKLVWLRYSNETYWIRARR